MADISDKVTADSSPLSRVAGMVTGGDIDVSGRHVVIRNYVAAYEFTTPAGQPFDAIFNTRPAKVSLIGEPQGESIGYSRDGQEWISTSEILVLSGERFPIFTSRPPSASAPRRHGGTEKR